MTGLLATLNGLARRLAVRRALASALTMAGALAFALALAALAAREGLTSGLRWLPLLWWLAVAIAVSWTVRAVRRNTPTGTAAARDTASIVEREFELRRGSLQGMADVARSLPAGTSPELAERASRIILGSLPASGPASWAPAEMRVLGRRLGRLSLAAAAGAVLAAVSLWHAGPAAAALVSPLRAVRAVIAPRVSIAASARSVRPGESVTVTVTSTAPGRLVLYTRSTGETWRPVILGAQPDGRAEHVISDIREPLFVHARLDGVTSDTLRIAVVEPLFVSALQVRAQYPPYVARADEDLRFGAGEIELPVGTFVSIRGAASARIARSVLVSGADTVALVAEGAGFHGGLVIRGSARWALEVGDDAGAELANPPVLEVRAVPDRAPTVSVTVPGRDTTAPLDLRQPLVVEATDDYGLGRVDVVSWRVSRLGVVWDTVVEPLPDAGGADRAIIGAVLDLTRRGLLPGDTLRYFVRAGDRAPAPHVGRSREYALRLRSMAELRDAVRLGADSLSRRAGGLAADQHELTRSTEDLSAQRNRSGDRGAAPPGARPDEAGTVPFEQAAEAQRVLERQEEIARRAEALRDELDRLTRAARDAGLTDPAWQERLRELEELVRQAVTPELQQRLEELRRALERLDPRAVQEALRRLATEQRRMRAELERSAELFERAAIEGALQTYARDAETLRREQEEWARRAPDRRDSAAAAAEERRLAQAADSLERGLAGLEDRLRLRGDTAAAAALDAARRSVETASGEMGRASQAMSRGERREAAERGRQAVRALERVPSDLERTQRELSSGWRAEVLRMLASSLDETISLAGAEHRMARQLRRGEGSADARGRQSDVEQGIAQIQQRLQEAAGRNALVSPRVSATLQQARERVGQSRQALEGASPNPAEAAERAGEAADLLAAAAFQLLRNRDEVAGAQSGSGFAEAVERMARLAGMQGELIDELGGLIPLLGSGQEAVLQELRRLAERQRALANELERLRDAGLPGRPDQLAGEARELADRIEAGLLDRATLERQQQLFRRMLDAGRTLRNDDEPEDPERRSETARERAARMQLGSRPLAPAQRFPVPPWSALKDLTPAERAMVLDYFRRLNAPDR